MMRGTFWSGMSVNLRDVSSPPPFLLTSHSPPSSLPFLPPPSLPLTGFECLSLFFVKENAPCLPPPSPPQLKTELTSVFIISFRFPIRLLIHSTSLSRPPHPRHPTRRRDISFKRHAAGRPPPPHLEGCWLRCPHYLHHKEQASVAPFLFPPVHHSGSLEGRLPIRECTNQQDLS